MMDVKSKRFHSIDCMDNPPPCGRALCTPVCMHVIGLLFAIFSLSDTHIAIHVARCSLPHHQRRRGHITIPSFFHISIRLDVAAATTEIEIELMTQFVGAFDIKYDALTHLLPKRSIWPSASGINSFFSISFQLLTLNAIHDLCCRAVHLFV